MTNILSLLSHIMHPCILLLDFVSFLQIYALKTLVKSFLPHEKCSVNVDIADLTDLLSKLLQKGSPLLCCSNDRRLHIFQI